MTSDSALDFRYERKFHAPDVSLEQVAMVVANHPAHFVKAFPNRRINNVYFDTADLSDFRAHVLGTDRRRKVRIRWYGESRGQDRPVVLEVKARRGTVGTKRHFALPPLDFDGRISMDAVRAATADGTPAAAMAGFFACAQPALFNSYLRSYFVSIDRRFRITIDTEMEFHIVNDRCYSHVRSYKEERLRIIELKYGAGDDDDAARIAGRLPFRLTKHSKYVSGLGRLRSCED